jgi:phosphoglycolate phosphatase-like HAD superfamily hydrolase
MLILFDIDGTLLQDASRDHALALRAALEDVYGVSDLPRSVSAAGRTDIEIARAMLLTHGLDAQRIDDGLDELRARACAEFARVCPRDLSPCVTPGIAALLGSLAARADARLSLVTGNLEPIARLKLTRAGIGHHFPLGQGGFGSDSEDRTELPAIARRRAGQPGEIGWASYPRERTLVVGDTPRDIACARADGVRCVAVATGPFPASDLRAADAVATDGVELATVLERELAP